MAAGARTHEQPSMTMQPMSAESVAPHRGVRADGALAPGAILSVTAARPTAAPSRLSGIFDVAAFVLLTMAAGALLFRPADLLPALRGAPIYEVLIIACLGASAPSLLQQFAARSFHRNGVLVALCLLAPAVGLSHLANANTWDARISGMEMLKACTLSLLVVTLVDTPLKLQRLFVAVLAAVFAVATLSILHYHEILYVPALASIEQRSAGGEESILRACGIGVFNDPNDFALLLVIAMSICAYGLFESERRIVRGVLVCPMLVFGYALILTHSRGGFLAALVAIFAFMQARLGWRNAIALAILTLPPLILLLSGRQTALNLDDPEDTFQMRLQLWSDAFGAFWYAPVFGIGSGKLVDRFGAVAHNSYVQAFTEMGLLGGTLFVGAFFLALRGLWQARPAERAVDRLRPCLLAMTASYAAGLLALSRCYTVPTQLVVALAAAYLSMGRSALPAFGWRTARTLTLVSVVVLVGTYAFLRVMLR